MDSAGAENTVKRFFEAWIKNDVDAAMRFVADDCVYALYISQEALPFAGESVGRDSVEAALREARRQFRYLVFRPYNYNVRGDTVRFRVEFMYRHNASGEILSGRFRMVMQLRDGRIVRADEYHDRAMVEAFMRLFGGS
ncbi:nuclear transport factor 2 family protein [Hyphomicrobium sp. CS1GBMeth3]|uniref:nuclear transport factor 2 family protein n=1 Tax=Hyphomicrobium sp. CS1GBMeth3 TaxID=1892845 RepID=UPI0009304CC2|nr:nuclear transport factor 2 family protein [Hyphomicrobium sp. CS1GBMeth3]